MPRRQFIADLQKTQQGVLPLGVGNLQQGEDDGQLEFDFTGDPAIALTGPVRITAIITDLGDYPESHEYMIFCSDDAPRYLASALQRVRGTDRKTIFELLDIIAAALSTLSVDHDGDTQMPDSQYDDDQAEDEDDDDIYDSDHEAFKGGADQHQPPSAQPTITTGMLRASTRAFRNRLRSDLLATKDAGFRIGHLGHLLDGFNAYITVSIRMSHLGVSEEAMQAWKIESSDYLILILQYQNGYKTNEELQGIENHRLASNIGMKVCAGKKYKPTLQQAIDAFTVAKKTDRESVGSTNLPAAEEDVDEDAVRDTFISKPLNSLLQERLVPILRFRSAGMDWYGAENHYDEITKTTTSNGDAVSDKHFKPEPTNHALADIVNADHYKTKGLLQYSFPLLTMQFVLRHFVRCTEYCLVCHRQLDTDVEAIKPYVCDAPLCLYQYMTLGFGPSIEHEILTQPYVVDLLVSFCYNSAAANKLKEYPDGLALVAPPIDPAKYSPPDPYAMYGSRTGKQLQQDANANLHPQPASRYEIGFDRDRLEIIFFNPPKECPVRRGSWIVIKTTGTLEGSELHCRVSDVNYFPTISIDEPVVLTQPSDGRATPAGSAPTSGTPKQPRTITPATTPKWATAVFQIYEQDFDQLSQGGKCLAICKLLETLPPVPAIQEYLGKQYSSELKRWIDHISPSALSLLRWIIASNRACIMQVDGDSGSSGSADKKAATVFSKTKERLYGMKDYMQFRFAMGAPDKEQRFVTEVRNTTDRLKLKYPTIFAWHGSPLHNWHMIIREGLHFKHADHGRAYGDGVYHAKDAHTSTGYSGMHHYTVGTSPARGYWPNSVLRINSALALNEVVNAPEEFTSSNPYYVVQHLDWIQTRYLFVQCAPTVEGIQIGQDTKPINPHPQDPARTPRGMSDSVIIPASAIKSGRAAKRDREMLQGQSPSKKLKTSLGGFANPVPVDEDDAESVATDAEDLEILFEDDPESDPEPESRGLPLMNRADSKLPGSKTDFVPGKLDFSTLPTMPAPTYAISSTTKRLTKELINLQKVQESSPLADLGWYIDVEKIENVYQWIVELHSFHVIDPKLPLVADMEKQNVTSIVLEVRFNKDFPFTPPYVRVIRPRFLSRMQGGGGHIVMGGAMCMELLTNTGWSSVSSMESVFMQIRLAIASDPPARLDTAAKYDYATGEAADGYIRACQSHGWTVPPGFKEMAYGGQFGAAL